METKRVKTKDGYKWRIKTDDGKYAYYKIKGTRGTKSKTQAEGKFLKRQERKAEKLEASKYTEAYEVETQSSYDTHKKGKYNTVFQYSLKGYFENEPSGDKMETMLKSTLMNRFNSGRTRKAYLKGSVFDGLIENSIRGYSVRKVRVLKTEVNNRVQGKLEIKNNGNYWESK